MIKTNALTLIDRFVTSTHTESLGQVLTQCDISLQSALFEGLKWLFIYRKAVIGCLDILYIHLLINILIMLGFFAMLKK